MTAGLLSPLIRQGLGKLIEHEAARGVEGRVEESSQCLSRREGGWEESEVNSPMDGFEMVM